MVMMVLLAVFVPAVPTALAQTPMADQYESISAPTAAGDPTAGARLGEGAAPGAERVRRPVPAAGVAPAGGGATRPVEIPDPSPADSHSLPFTGGQISLLALIGLGLLTLGAAGVAATGRRGACQSREST